MAEDMLSGHDLRPLSVVSAMAWVTYRLGQKDLSKVHTWYHRVLHGREKILGPTDPETLTTLNDLGFICEKEGLYSESEQYPMAALSGRQARKPTRSYGGLHSDNVRSQRPVPCQYALKDDDVSRTVRCCLRSIEAIR